MPDDDAKVDGLAERFVTKRFDSFMQAQPSKVDGLAERISREQQHHSTVSVNTFTRRWSRRENDQSILEAGIEQVDPSIVSGIAERTINGAGDLVVTDPSKVAGIAERIVVLEEGRSISETHSCSTA